MDTYKPSVAQIVEFLTELYHEGMSYSALNTARSALSSIVSTQDNLPCGEHPLVKRLMKGFFNARPSLPRYNYTWSPEQVLAFLDEWSPPEKLTLRQLTLKVVTLIALITGQRCQTIHCMDLNSMQKTNDRFRFIIESMIKTTKPGSLQPVLILPMFTHDDKRCIYKFLVEYLNRTANLRLNHSKLFISFYKPHEAVHKETISRWIRTVLSLAKIDLDVFKPHSTRSASASAASRSSVPLPAIMKAATWKTDSVFRIFYNKPLDTEEQFALAILNKN